MLDHTDRQIIEELSKNSRMTMKELGEKVHLTGQAASSRVVYHKSESSQTRVFYSRFYQYLYKKHLP